MGQILKAFISYRRRDAYVSFKNGEADNSLVIGLQGALRKAGFNEVFLDTGNIEISEDYKTKIYDAVSDADLVVAVVGNRWLDILREKEKSGEYDILLDEIKIALDREKEIVPLLVDGASMPNESDLPESIRPFHDRNAQSTKSADFEQKIVGPMARIAGKITWRRQRASWWFRAYLIVACLAWYFCAIQPHIVGFLEFGPKSWGAMAAIWSGFFIWPIFFLPLALFALRPPILSIIESVTSTSRFHDKIVYLTPLIFGTILAGLAIAIELGGQETPWSIHPALPDCPRASSATRFQPLSHYNAAPDAAFTQDFGDQFWMKDSCWPNVFYYLTVPLYSASASSEYLARRPAIAHSFNSMLRDGGAPHSMVFYPYVISFSVLIWLLGTGVVMSIFYVMVQIRRPDDFSILRLPSERAYIYLTYTFITMMIWVPFRINTDYFKYLYSCTDSPACHSVDPKLYFVDMVLAVSLLICYSFLSLGLVVKYKRWALALLGALAVTVALLGALLIYKYRVQLAGISDTWQFSVGLSIPIILLMLALGYAFDPSITRFDGVEKDD
ncbi:toll/interleukin-1 receptor domain-containing protein [Bradyrhizobium tropiciagri]|nr:toll/interleukin-1 receptor domain-containing protein [Bradyrhizobium tropiciagri]